MTLIFQDLFEEAVDTPLASHAPDTGAGWVVIYDTTTAADVLVKPNGQSNVPFLAGPSTSENSVGKAYAISPAPAEADVTIQADRYMLNWEVGNTYGCGMFARHSESAGFHTCYAIRFVPNLHSTASIQLYKVIGNGGQLLGEYDHPFANGDVITFECHDAAKRVLVNGVERITSSDNAITGAGNAGLVWGTFPGFGTMHMRAEMEFGFFAAETVSAGPVYVDLDAAPGGLASPAADLAALRDLIASVPGASTLAADFSVLRALMAAPEGMGAVGAALAATRDLMTGVTGEATLAADLAALALQRDLAVDVAGAGLVEAALDVRVFVDLVAGAQGDASALADLDLLMLGAAGDVRTWSALVRDAALTETWVTALDARGAPAAMVTVTPAPLAQLRTAGQRATLATVTDEVRG